MIPGGIKHLSRDSKRWCTVLAGSYLNKRKAAEMRLFHDATVNII